jgi:hypothetical protein
MHKGPHGALFLARAALLLCNRPRYIGDMLRRLIVALAAASALGISSCPTDASARRTRAAVTDGVPSWDVTASCRAASSIAFGQTPTERLKSCLDSEQRTREGLNKNWSTFPAADRIACVKSLTFSPTYTELATCLEMRRDLKNSRDAKPADTKTPGQAVKP